MRIFVITAILVVLGLVGLYVYKSGSAEPSAAQVAGASAPSSQEAPKGSQWTTRCDEPQEGKTTNCEVFQSLSVTKTKQRFMEVAFARPKDANETMVAIILPLGIVVSAGGTLQAGEDTQGKKFQILTCLPEGCLARFKLDDAFMAKLKAADTMTVGLADVGGKPLKVKLSLEGFSEALASLQR